MQAGAAAGVGLALGLAGGIAAGVWIGRPAAEPGAFEPADPHADCRATEAALRAELALRRAAPPPLAPALGADAATLTRPMPPSGTATDGTDSATPPAASAGAPAVAGAAPAPADPAKAARKAAPDEIRRLLDTVKDAPPGSAAVLALVATWRAQARGEDALLAELAGRALLRLARDGKLRPEDAEPLAADFAALAAGAPSRPGLAGAVARAWARDARLADWFTALPAVAEPTVRDTVVWALDETPSEAYRDWVVRLSQSEQDLDVLKSVWNEDIVLVALTRATAPRMAAAMEPRLGQGDVPPKLRARGYFALGLIAQQDAAAARAALARLAASEADGGVRRFAEGVLDLIAREESNLQALEGLWDAHRDTFGAQ
jgi:hypothetical protein